MSLNIPLLTEAAEKQGPKRTQRFEEAIRTIEQGVQNQKIWNTDFTEARAAIVYVCDEALEQASQWWINVEPRPSQENWESNDPRWNIWYKPQFSNVPGAVKKLEKFKGTWDTPEQNAGFEHELETMKEIAQLVILANTAKPFIVKGRKPAENPKEVDVTNTGTCPICTKRHKLTFQGRLVAHGYTIERHSWSGRNGICFGTDCPAWELSPDGAIAYQTYLEEYTVRLQEKSKNLNAGVFETLSKVVQMRKNFGEYENVTKTYEKGTPEYAEILRLDIAKTTQTIEFIRQDLEILTARIAAWKAEPLKYGGAETQDRWKSKLLK